MTRSNPALSAAIGVAGAALLALAGAAHADVKAGVDAWSAGDYARAVSEWRAPAARGDADALFNLAQAYRLGRGVAEDLEQAEKLYARAAASGHLKAADNYGLLLFQEGRRDEAMPYVVAAAERGDPRAQYLLGIAHFNGDSVPRDWVRAYALLTLANGAGLPQAAPAIQQMDGHVPLAQRQQAQALAAAMRADADVRRSAQMASSDLADGGPSMVANGQPAVSGATAAPPVPSSARVPQPVATVTVPPSVPLAEAAVAEAMRATGTESPATAGADFARPGRSTAVTPEAPARDLVVAAAPGPGPGAVPSREAGPWRVQLGAFSIAANADRAWSQVSGSAALAGKAKQVERAGRLTRLLAAGWSDRSAAQAACAALKAGGHACIVTR